jgi:DNA adenine methylase
MVAAVKIQEARPAFRLVGGKTQLLPELRKHVPSRFGRYFEPFVGAGALFFYLQSQGYLSNGAVLGDVNDRFMATYRALRNTPERVVDALRWYAKGYKKHGAAYYLNVRKEQVGHAGESDAETAAWLLFMQAAGFNGVYRENLKGGYNAPPGKFKNPPRICDEENLYAVSRALRGTILLTGDFGMSLVEVKRGDFWYADPPYWPASASADFTAYSKEKFGSAEQERLRDVALSLKEKGVRVLLSNADVEPVRKLYAKGFEVRRVEARRSVNSMTTKRGHVGELLIW